MKRNVIIILALLVATIISAKEPKRPESYNYQRGVQAAWEQNTDEALTYLNKEINDNHKNGYAYAWLSAVRYNNGDYGMALTNANYALQHLPKNDKVYYAWAYRIRADAYLVLKDTTEAIADYTVAIKLEPTNEDYYKCRAQVYYELGKYDLSNKDYEQMIKLRPGDVYGYMGIGRNLNAQKKYKEAIQKFTHVITLAEDYASGYSFRAESYCKLGEYSKAVQDVIKAIELDWSNEKAGYLLVHGLADSAFNEIKIQLEVMQKKNPNEWNWPMLLAVAHERQEQYSAAIDYYKKRMT